MQQLTTGHQRWSRGFRYGVAAVGALTALAFLLVSWQIGSDVQETSTIAIRQYGGDQISALMTYVDSPLHSLQDRNRAVWALGQLGDARALPVLEKHFTGKPCDHGRRLCQRELGKAIELCRGGINVTALVWRPASVLE